MHRKDIEGIPLSASNRVGSHSSRAQRRLCADRILKRNVKFERNKTRAKDKDKRCKDACQDDEEKHCGTII